MTLPIDLVLVRHGESEGNAAKRMSEKGDDSAYSKEFLERHTSSFRLTRKGREQALAGGHWLRSEFCNNNNTFDRFLVSEYTRAEETAARLELPNASWYLEPYLSERLWGTLDVMTEAERLEKFKESLRMRNTEPFFWRPPNGESYLDLRIRVDRVLDTLHRECSDKRVILVCHGEVMWAFRIRLERLSKERFKELHLSENPDDRIHNCQIIHYTRRNPATGRTANYANWMRMVRPTENPVRDFGWKEIERPRFSNEELLEIVMKVEPMVE